MADNYLLKIYDKFLKLPYGRQLFSWYSARRAPYFSTISPLITVLRPDHCEVAIKKRKLLQNHIGTMHVIAICNGLEMAMGFMCEASIPKNLRWIPKGMEVKYPAKAATDIRCVAKVAHDAWKPGDLSVEVKAYDLDDNIVIEGTITIWVSEKSKQVK
ncbi:hotdog fold domain-containing protein [Alteromonas lipotrueiana]|uniref:hotdog fold domain-containing protein n=1 Tax=Alteromonas lipotrueiana TaxID=2803815 RepID=UPI001C464D0E|nr:hotdog fold domain-containing protein [Alteromonas lipotrueiana]